MSTISFLSAKRRLDLKILDSFFDERINTVVSFKVPEFFIKANGLCVLDPYWHGF
jgi:hypothetical protein